MRKWIQQVFRSFASLPFWKGQQVSLHVGLKATLFLRESDENGVEIISIGVRDEEWSWRTEKRIRMRISTYELDKDRRENCEYVA